MANVRILVHAKSCTDERLQSAVHKARKQGHRVEVRVMWEAADVERLTAEAVREASEGRIECIVAGGGDGTVNKVFAAACAAGLPPGCSLAVIPLGTGNDFARAADIPIDDIEAALEIALAAEPRSIDAGQLDGRMFVNAVSGGFGSRVTVETDPGLKERLGALAYAITGIARFLELSASKGRFRAEGFEWEGEFLALGVGNGRSAGGGIPLCADALLDDGLLDLTIIHALDRTERHEAFSHLLHEGAAGLLSSLVSARSPWIEFESDEDLNVNLDGEPLLLKSFRVEVLPGALPVRLGKSAAIS